MVSEEGKSEVKKESKKVSSSQSVTDSQTAAKASKKETNEVKPRVIKLDAFFSVRKPTLSKNKHGLGVRDESKVHPLLRNRAHVETVADMCQAQY